MSSNPKQATSSNPKQKETAARCATDTTQCHALGARKCACVAGVLCCSARPHSCLQHNNLLSTSTIGSRQRSHPWVCCLQSNNLLLQGSILGLLLLLPPATAAAATCSCRTCRSSNCSSSRCPWICQAGSTGSTNQLCLCLAVARTIPHIRDSWWWRMGMGIGTVWCCCAGCACCCVWSCSCMTRFGSPVVYIADVYYVYIVARLMTFAVWWSCCCCCFCWWGPILLLLREWFALRLARSGRGKERADCALFIVRLALHAALDSWNQCCCMQLRGRVRAGYFNRFSCRLTSEFAP
jgi:hypothetical protein